MKRIKAVTFLLLAALVLSSCSPQAGITDKDGLKIVATVFPAYDWVREISRGSAGIGELTLLIGNGTDMHSFNPSAADIIKISGCDVFVYVGGESDKWVKDALSGAENKDMTVINLMELLSERVKEEEDDGDRAHGEGPEYDEHVWLSLKNAELVCEKIAGVLCEKDTENEKIYRENAAEYIGKLKELDGKYLEAVNEANVKTLVFADRFPFRYLFDDYGLSHYAAFPGCSAETEASFETVVFLANKTDELGLKSVIKLESSDGSVAETVIENTKSRNKKIIELDSMQSISMSDISAGATYIGIMEKNLGALGEALQNTGG